MLLGTYQVEKNRSVWAIEGASRCRTSPSTSRAYGCCDHNSGLAAIASTRPGLSSARFFSSTIVSSSVGNTAKHRLGEPVAFEPRPRVQSVAGHVDHVHGPVVRGEGVELPRAEQAVDLLELVGDRPAVGRLVLLVDLREQLLAVLADRVAQLLVELAQAIEVALLGDRIAGAERARALVGEHVLEVVREPGRVGGLLGRARAHGDPTRDPRLLVVLAQVDAQAIVQRVDADGHLGDRSGSHSAGG